MSGCHRLGRHRVHPARNAVRFGSGAGPGGGGWQVRNEPSVAPCRRRGQLGGRKALYSQVRWNVPRNARQKLPSNGCRGDGEIEEGGEEGEEKEQGRRRPGGKRREGVGGSERSGGKGGRGGEGEKGKASIPSVHYGRRKD